MAETEKMAAPSFFHSSLSGTPQSPPAGFDVRLTDPINGSRYSGRNITS